MHPDRTIPAAIRRVLPALLLALATTAAAAPAPEAPAPRLNAEERALRQIQDEGRREAEALAKAMEGLPDGPAYRALQRRVVEVKKAARVRFLRARAGFALGRGDLEDARECERVLAALLGPPKPGRAADLARPLPAAPGGGRP